MYFSCNDILLQPVFRLFTVVRFSP